MKVNILNIERGADDQIYRYFFDDKRSTWEGILCLSLLGGLCDRLGYWSFDKYACT